MIPTRDRAAVGAMLASSGLIDIIVPRGGRSLIERVMAESRIPVIAHLEGICHAYVNDAADPAMARDIFLYAKIRRTGICTPAETFLIHRAIPARHPTVIVDDLHDARCGMPGEAPA